MPARYHFYNTIYLYGIFEESTAHNIIGNNNAKLPLILYETPLSAYDETDKNIQNKVILRFAVNIGVEPYIDDLITESKKVLNKVTKGQLEDYKDKCNYIRKYDVDKKKIVYIIKSKQIIKSITAI